MGILEVRVRGGQPWGGGSRLGVPISRVEFKICQCRMSLSLIYAHVACPWEDPREDPSWGGGWGGGGSWESGPPPFGQPPNFIKRGKTLCLWARMQRDLVVTSYPHPPFLIDPHKAKH